MPYADNIERIDLILENCEVVSIDRKYLGRFFIGNIVKEIRRIACNAIDEIVTAKESYIEINRNSDTEQTNMLGKNYYPLERLRRYNDIAAVDIIYADGKTDYYYTDYDEGENENCSGAENINQKSKFNNFGDLYISIGESINIDEVFPDGDINDKESIDFMWGVFDCHSVKPESDGD